MWGSGLAASLHDAVLVTFGETTTAVRLWVFEQNLRARRFYEKQGWRDTGECSESAFRRRS
jgi:RimJ/RimL family protein N-acetyltransferase